MENKDIKDYTYTEAVNELEGLLRAMESENCDIDRLAAYTSRALVLLKFCRERLFTVNDEVEKCLAELQSAMGEHS